MQAANTSLTPAKISEIARQAQIDFCLDKATSFEIAFARGIELAIASAPASQAGRDALDAKRLDALENAEQRDGWIVAKNVGSFTAHFGRGQHATRKTLREAIDAALAGTPGAPREQQP